VRLKVNDIIENYTIIFDVILQNYTILRSFPDIVTKIPAGALLNPGYAEDLLN
jgi:hypothetical protein